MSTAPMAADAALAVWKRADAVCFDVDSTVITTEGIDELAKYAGVDVSELTRKYVRTAWMHVVIQPCAFGFGSVTSLRARSAV